MPQSPAFEDIILSSNRGSSAVSNSSVSPPSSSELLVGGHNEAASSAHTMRDEEGRRHRCNSTPTTEDGAVPRWVADGRVKTMMAQLRLVLRIAATKEAALDRLNVSVASLQEILQGLEVVAHRGGQEVHGRTPHSDPHLCRVVRELDAENDSLRSRVQELEEMVRRQRAKPRPKRPDGRPHRSDLSSSRDTALHAVADSLATAGRRCEDRLRRETERRGRLQKAMQVLLSKYRGRLRTLDYLAGE